MGDFEDTFGVGANAVAIIDAYCSVKDRDIETPRWLTDDANAKTSTDNDPGLVFPTFKEAARWARENPGRSITRSHLGDHFVVKIPASSGEISMKYRTPLTEFDVPF